MAVRYNERTNSYCANIKGKQFLYSVNRYGPLAKLLAERSVETQKRHKNFIEVHEEEAIMSIYHAPSQNIYEVRLDNDDVPLVEDLKWYINVPQNARTLYVANDKVGKLHRYLMGVEDPADVVDHIDRNGLNNHRDNLRITDASSNSRNMDTKASNKLNHNGVCYEPPVGKHAGRYKATWMENGVFHTKSFSEAKYPNALELAIEFREQKERELGYIQQ